MKKTFFFFVLLLISGIVSAQGIDFSGNWKLNTAKSKLSDQFSMAPKESIIAQKDNDFNIEKHSTYQDQDFTINDKFTLDGKECVNPGWQGSQKKSIVAWSDDKTSLKITSKLPIGDSGELTIVEVYKMDGSSLVVESSASSSYGDVVETQVFDKQ